MNRDKIDKLLKEQILNKTNIRDGYDQIKQVLTDNNLPMIDLDTDELKDEFKEWLLEVIEKEPIPKDIKSIYFGLTTMSFPEIDNGKEKTTAYIAGSQLTPDQDSNWACDTEYFPDRRYVLLDSFEKIDELLKNNQGLNGEYAVLVFNGLLNLLVLSTVDDIKNKLLTYQSIKLGLIKTEKRRDRLYLGSGFDSGDLYLLGKLKNE